MNETRSATPGEPETEAGRRLYRRIWAMHDAAADILAIEAEARAESSAVHRHIPEWPSTCTGCEHLAADLVRRAPAWMRVGERLR